MGRSNYLWESLYCDALSETNPAKLPLMIGKAESAIFVRIQALDKNPSSTDERQALHEAADGLLALKRNVLKWPDSSHPSNGSQPALGSDKPAAWRAQVQKQ